VREVATVLEYHQLRVWDALVHDLRLRGWADEIVATHKDKRGRGVEQDEMAEPFGVAQSVLQGDKSSERIAEDGDLLVAQVRAQGVGICAELLEGERLLGWPARAAVTTVVVVDQVHLLAQRI
jgi:hypothetical protein